MIMFASQNWVVTSHVHAVAVVNRMYLSFERLS